MSIDVAPEALTPAQQVAALPKKLSPSAAGTYTSCPQKFYYEKVVGLPSSPSLATAKGNVAHLAFERIFDAPAQGRTPDAAAALIPGAWQSMIAPGENASARDIQSARGLVALAPAGSSAEAEILADAERFVRNWFNMEKVAMLDPAATVKPDGTIIDGREVYLTAKLSGASWHGFVDRLDSWTDAAGNRLWSITDYKTGRVPSPRWREKYFFQLRVYAAMAQKMMGITPSMLRLVFVAGGGPEHIIRDDAYAADPDAVIAATSATAAGIWKKIQTSAKDGNWPAKVGPLCRFCDFAQICPALSGPGAGLPLDE